VQGNRFFMDGGLSQLFVLEHSDHVTYWDNPDQLTEFIIGFCKRTLRNTF